MEKEIKQYKANDPAQLYEMAGVLKSYIVKNKLYTEISGKNYAHVDGWQFAGSMLGLYPLVTYSRNLSNEKELKWQTKVEIIDSKKDLVVGRGYAICSNKENKRKNADEYVICSMSQTRAIGKAYRNLLGWVIKLAGYESTPAEEVNENVVKKPKKREDKEDKEVDYLEKIKTLFNETDEKKVLEKVNEKLGTKYQKLVDPQRIFSRLLLNNKKDDE